MLRIVGVQRNEYPEKEFVLLQNQGSMRINLRGHALLSESAFNDRHLCEVSHVFREDLLLAPGLYVVLYSGEGSNGWRKTRDGQTVYHAYMNSGESVWNECSMPLHVLNTQHTYAERREPLLLR